jgi:hypothetical protein
VTWQSLMELRAIVIFKNSSTPTPAALSGPIMTLLLTTFFLNAGSGIGLWIWKTQMWRVIHGWSLPPFLVTFGVIWRVHILRGWRLKKNIFSGMVTILVFLLLTITGWAIYYSGSDEVQHKVATWHTWLGLGVSLILFVHALLGWQTREKLEDAGDSINPEI